MKESVSSTAESLRTMETAPASAGLGHQGGSKSLTMLFGAISKTICHRGIDNNWCGEQKLFILRVKPKTGGLALPSCLAFSVRAWN